MKSEIVIAIYGIVCTAAGVFIGKYWGAHHSSVLAIIHKEIEVLETKFKSTTSTLAGRLDCNYSDNQVLMNTHTGAIDSVVARIITLENEIIELKAKQCCKSKSVNTPTTGTNNVTNGKDN